MCIDFSKRDVCCPIQDGWHQMRTVCRISEWVMERRPLAMNRMSFTSSRRPRRRRGLRRTQVTGRRAWPPALLASGTQTAPSSFFSSGAQLCSTSSLQSRGGGPGNQPLRAVTTVGRHGHPSGALQEACTSFEEPAPPGFSPTTQRHPQPPALFR